jgi:hypothetical protein
LVADSSENLVLVAGHSIVRDFARLTEDDAWFLLDFQRGEPTRYIGHVEAAVRRAADDENSLLIFSGGATRAEAGPRTEALSYWLIAEQHDWWGSPGVRSRAHVEDFARDSFENLLFGICRFRELANREPVHVTMVSWEFKRERFEELHREAIGWPRDRFTYIGANDPPHLDQALRSEESIREKYRADPYSLSHEFRQKKDARNPTRRQHGYAISCPDLFTLDKPWVLPR